MNTPIPITPTQQPTFPCWLWDSSPRMLKWVYCQASSGALAHEDYTHWLPAMPPPTTPTPPVPPGAEDFAAADRILEGGSFAQAQSARPFVLAALREGRKLEHERIMPTDGTSRAWVPAGQCDALRNQLDAAEQHAKILQKRVDDYAAERGFWAGWQAEANDLRGGILSLCGLLGLPNGGGNTNRLHGLKVAICDLIEQRDTARFNLRSREEELVRAGLASPRPEMPKPRTRPWKLDEVPLNAWFRRLEGAFDRLALLSVHRDAVVLAHGLHRDLDGKSTAGNGRSITVTFDKLNEHYAHSIDAGRTWWPAGVAEAAP